MAVDFPAVQQDTTLRAAGFPESKFDYSFTERVAAMREGYAPFETQYDANGNCVSGCAYQGMNIDTEARRLERDIAITQQKIADYRALHPEVSGSAQEYAQQPNVTTAPTLTPAPTTPTAAARCQPLNSAIPNLQTIPLGLPLLGAPRITSGFQPARKNPVDGKVRDHNGIDFAAPQGTLIFSPASGTAERVFQDSACGKGVIIKHGEGFSTLYCHLSDNSIVRQGEAVGAGCLVAKTGNTGRSTGPHLHYGIYLNGLFVPPENFISR